MYVSLKITKVGIQISAEVSNKEPQKSIQSCTAYIHKHNIMIFIIHCSSVVDALQKSFIGRVCYFSYLLFSLFSFINISY